VTRFLIRRIVYAIIVMWVVSTVMFIMYFVAPNDPARVLAGKQATPDTVAALRRSLGLDQPIPQQYGNFLGRLIHGNLGYSYVSHESVNHIIARDFPITASLAVGAAVVWLVIGIASGILAATRPRSIGDRAVTTLALFFFSMPTFLLGLFLLLLLYFKLTQAGLPIFPSSGYVELTQNPGQWARHLILPWFTIAMVQAATYARLTRGSMMDVLGEDYIRTARAKGLSRSRVIYRHAVRSALTPLVTQFGIDIATLLSGVIVTETVFSLNGLGNEAVRSITNQDLPVILAIVLLTAAFVVAANVIVDIFYAVLDPRVRLS
jgi:peptide/nickel transport system permease protein